MVKCHPASPQQAFDKKGEKALLKGLFRRRREYEGLGVSGFLVPCPQGPVKPTG